MLKLFVGFALRLPLFTVAAKYIPENEPGLIVALIMFVVGDIVIAHYYETRGASKSITTPSGPANDSSNK